MELRYLTIGRNGKTNDPVVIGTLLKSSLVSKYSHAIDGDKKGPIAGA